MSMPLPGDMHGHVLELTCELVNASEVADTRTIWRLYGQLRD